MIVASAAQAGRLRREAVAESLHAPVWSVARLTGSVPAWLASHRANYSGLLRELPANIHLLTLQSHGPGALLLRLSHSYEVGEDAALSANATVSLAGLFNGLTITAATEMTLTGNQPLAAARRVTYSLADGSSVTLPVVPGEPAGPQMAVTLSALTIRTFMCSITVP